MKSLNRLVVFAALLLIFGCKGTVANLDPSEPRMTPVFLEIQSTTTPCVLFQKAGFMFGPNSAYDTERSPRLLVADSEVTFDMLKAVRWPGGKRWFQLADGRVQDLGWKDRIVVDAVMATFPGIELKDARPKGTWPQALLRGDVSAFEALPGHAFSECTVID